MTCETIEESLLDFVEGALTPEDARAVETHLRDCSACRRKYAETRALVGDLSAARGLEESAWRPAGADLAASTLKPGFRLGDFEILAELGRGGMGVVYRARQLSLNRIVALKLLAAGTVENERSVARFLREAQAAARLHHTNIVPIYAQGREGGYFYYAMELIEGESLDSVLRREARGQLKQTKTVRLPAAESIQSSPAGPRSATRLLRSAAAKLGLSRAAIASEAARDYRRIARWIAGAAEGLHHAHEQGVVHRDVKPQNLLVGPDDELHITDFGLARLLDEPSLTRTTEMVGTPAFMAPEQIAGGTIDRRTDVYALGVTLYLTLTLRRPFEGENYEQTIHQILKREPTPPRRLDPRIPSDLETICLRAMEKSPTTRFQTAADLARDLRRYLEGFPIASRPLGPVGKTLRWAKRNPAKALASATTGLLILLLPLLGVFSYMAGRAQIDQALDVLREDYRQKERALNLLGWAARLPGLKRPRDFITAFAHVRAEPDVSIRLLEALLRDRPGDVDARYLLAFAYLSASYTKGTEPLADARRHTEIADGSGIEPSALGWFFRGMAVWGTSPEDAITSFDRAIEKAGGEGFIFAQASLHQGRALNQMMYSWGEIEYYALAVSRLETPVRLQPRQAYPRYLLSFTHRLAAEIYQAQGRSDEARTAFDKALELAREAQLVEPTNPRGYAAEAACHESLGRAAAPANPQSAREYFRAALAAWDQYDNPALQIRVTPFDRSEWAVYGMRLYYWLGDFQRAEARRAARYGPAGGYDPALNFDADEICYHALISAEVAAAQSPQRLRQAELDRAVELVAGHPEYALRLYATCRAAGLAPPDSMIRTDSSDEGKLSPGWTASWLRTLIGYVRDEIAWPILEAAASQDVKTRDDPRLRMAGACYYKALKALAARDRLQAIAALERACALRDNENYCFRAQFLLTKLYLDPACSGLGPPPTTSAP